MKDNDGSIRSFNKLYNDIINIQPQKYVKNIKIFKDIELSDFQKYLKRIKYKIFYI